MYLTNACSGDRISATQTHVRLGRYHFKLRRGISEGFSNALGIYKYHTHQQDQSQRIWNRAQEGSIPSLALALYAS